MLTLPATSAEVLASVINPAFELLPAPMQSEAAKVQVLAIALQESGLKTRVQADHGPAHGLWQNEEDGGVKGVLTFPSTRTLAEGLCNRFDVEPNPPSVWDALAENDVLACCFARLLLWTDTQPLPELTAVNSAWNLYNRVWRPGKPKPDAWPTNYGIALNTVRN